MSIDREAYEAYARHTGWKSLATGQPLPQWDALPDAIKAAWKVSAAWVAGKVTGQHDWKESPTAYAIIREALVGLVGADSLEELNAIEAAVRSLPIADSDRLGTLNAIDALRRTLPVTIEL